MKSRLLLLLMMLSLALAACAGALGLGRVSTTHPFEHRGHVTKGVNCVECHAGVTHDDDTAVHFPPDAKCRSCHAKPHDEHACGGCHGDPRARSEASLARDHLKFQHARHLPRVEGDCVRCHQEVANAAPEALRPKMATCFGCHEHKDEWTVRSCDGCHKDLPSEHITPTSHLVHDGDFLREHGVRAASSRDLCASCHTERSCAACHGAGTVPALPARLAFDDAKLSGLHRAGFRARHAEESRANPGLCTSCHAESTCIDCHQRQKVAPGSAPRSPHPPGFLRPGRGGGDHGREARIDPAACAGCHGGAGEQLCVGCHKVGGPGGNPHGMGFASNRNKTHDLPCRLCHAGGT